ncbi:MAG: M23 family metallopeptidase [Bacteroidetes bacterium]|nr:M23 family metallopeptidase [Bacteroidota bacterium]
MSATFGETRAAHFHAAVDIGTWGQRGFRVYASRDGVLSRVGVSPFGYGNVVYLKHDDGSYSIYAHLQDFIPKIREIVDDIRFQDYRADFDQNLEHLDIRFNKGDLIAFTGDTGIGPPHLHFELRTPQNNPFNPLLAGIRVPDNVRPRFSSLSVEPLSSDALVNGRRQTAQISMAARGGNFSFGTVNVTGTVGLGVDVSDRADNMRNVYAVYELKMYVNDELFFHSRVDSFSMGTSRQMLLDRVYPILRSERRGFQRLFIRDGNTLAFYQDTGTDGKLRLPEGRHAIRIEAFDFFGNASTATGTLNVRGYETASPIISRLYADTLGFVDGNSGVSSHMYDFNWTNNWVANASNRRSHRISIIPDGSYSSEIHAITSFTNNAVVQFPNAPSATFTVDDEAFRVHRIYPNTRTVLRTPDQRLKVEFRANTVFDTLTVAFGYQYNEAGEVEITVGSDTEPLQGSYSVRFLLNDEEQKIENLALYTLRGNGSNRRLGFAGSRREGDFIIAQSSAFGRFTLAADTIPPTLNRPRIFRRNDGKWFATVRVNDNLSGVTHHGASFYVNGVRGIAEYDPFAGVLIYHHPNFRPSARNTLRVVLYDRSGNHVDQTFDNISR